VACPMECGSPDGAGVGCGVECSACLLGGGMRSVDIVDVDRDKRGRTFRREMISIGSIEVWMR